MHVRRRLKNPTAQKQKKPDGHSATGLLGVRDMLLITGRTGSNAEIILGLEQSDLNAS